MPDVGITFAILALGFALGYGVREQMSRKRHRRAQSHQQRDWPQVPSDF